MNVILYSDSDVFAGTERHILDLAAGLRALDVGVRIACPRPGALASRAEAASIPVLPIAKRGLVDRDAIRLLAAELRTGRADILHAHNGRTHVAAAFAARRAGRGLCIATQHFLSPTRTGRRGIKAFLAGILHRRAASATAHLVAISEAVRSAALARGDTPPGRITTVHNGAAAPDLTGMPAADELRHSLGIAPDAPVLFSAARLEPEKDIPTLLAAFHAVHSRIPAARCLIAGEGNQLSRLQQQARDLGLSGTVQFLGFRSDVPALMNAADVFILPSPAEPFGLVLLEAMALGKPVIATDAGGPPEIVHRNRSGLLVPPADPAAMADAIADLLADPPRRRAMGAAGLARYQEHFTVARMARDMLALYRRCLPAAPHAPQLQESS